MSRMAACLICCLCSSQTDSRVLEDLRGRGEKDEEMSGNKIMTA